MTRPARAALAAVAAVVAALGLPLLVAATPAGGADHARPATTRTAVDNPLADRPWGVYRGGAEMAWTPYVRATGERKRLLGKIALRPKAKWFGDWIGDDAIAGKVREYVRNAQAGDPETLVQMTVFRMMPWEQEACRRLPTAAEQASYRRWIDRFAGAVGDAHVALVLQPDGPFALCAPGGSRLPSSLVAYAARVFSALPHTSVYIEAGAADWHRDDVRPAVQLLLDGGIAVTRGFALNTTHYDSTPRQVRYGARVVAELARRGVPGVHFVVDTAENGRAFTGEQWRAAGRPGGRFDNARTCRTRAERRCVTLGIPPTWRVGDPRWRLPADVRALAEQHVDAFLWAGRPWLRNQNSPFSMSRGLAVARTTRW
ncbi:glycoside hydrolase family 6 protein [Nocardioides sp. SYSU D00038]|uniref:glycoside hydrolase family 6 protein n=1 Tax=Nocardioides sp. SYSU D00038 TaxID=2812554 RepID=UPI00196713A4|nr:glycoside hydrolase family 6 protein [Nocardioides sp. SYSU D00038]